MVTRPQPARSNVWLWGFVIVAPGVAWAAHAGLGFRLQHEGLTGWLWALALAPLIEEIAMRPLLQRGLHERLKVFSPVTGAVSPRWRLDPTAAYLANGLTALVFAALHMPVQGWAALWWLVPALALGQTWCLHGQLWRCVGLHAWFNLCLAMVSR